jgi:hypothetical protein
VPGWSGRSTTRCRTTPGSPAVETALARRLAELAHALHLHAEGAAEEVEPVFPVPRARCRWRGTAPISGSTRHRDGRRRGASSGSARERT